MEFHEAIEVVLEHEGGYVDHPNDPGGETKYGITKRSYPNLNIKNLTIEEAKVIYKQDFWDKNKIEKYPYGIRLMMFDMAVNMGNRNAVKVLQRAMNRFDIKHLRVDGIAGKNTNAAVSLLFAMNKGFLLLSMLNGERITYYVTLAKSEKFRVFLVGWVKRANMVFLASAR